MLLVETLLKELFGHFNFRFTFRTFRLESFRYSMVLVLPNVLLPNVRKIWMYIEVR